MQLIMYLFVLVCLCVINFCKQYILRTNLWMFAQFLADTPNIADTTLEMITFKVTENECPKIFTFHFCHFLSGINSTFEQITL